MHTTDFDPYDFSKKEIGGVPVYWKNLPTAPCIHIRICFNTGSLHDPADQLGLSHFLEHMIFNGCPSLPDKKSIKEWSKKYALNSWNAWTWFTNTDYHLRCLPEHFDEILRGLEDIIFHPLLKDEDIEHERSVITQEAWGRYLNEKYLAYARYMLKNLFHGTQREHLSSPLGWPESIAIISQQDVRSWHEKNYGKGNFFIVLGGPIADEHLEKIEKFIEKVPSVKGSGMDFGVLSKPQELSVTKHAHEIGLVREQVEISFNRILDPKLSPEEEIRFMAADVLYDILIERLRTERALCYNISVSGGYMQRDFISWEISLKTKEEHTDLVLKEFWKALQDIIQGNERERFENLKQVRIDQLKSREETTGSIVEYALGDIWRYRKIITIHEALTERQKVSYEDVVACLTQAFEKDWTVTEIILPSPKAAPLD